MSLNEGRYTWTISDPVLINKILNAPNGVNSEAYFDSDIFRIGKLNWQIRIYPNGWNKNNIGAFNVCLKLTSLHSSWKNVAITRTMESPQTKSAQTTITEYTEGHIDGWPDYILALQEIKKLKLKELIFVIKIKIIEIKLKTNDKIYYHIKFNYNKNQQVIWALDQQTMNALKFSNNRKRFYSPIYNSMWSIAVAPNGADKKSAGNSRWCLTLCALPFNVKKMKIQSTVSIKQLNFKRTNTNNYSFDKHGFWNTITSFEEFKSCNNLTIVVDILILTEWDNNDKVIQNVSTLEWDQYIQQEQKQNFTEISNIDNNKSYQYNIDDKLSLSMND